MNEVAVTFASLLSAVVLGLFLGGFFFGGLWWTVQKLASSKSGGLWFVVSLLLRITVVIVGFYYVGKSDWRLMLGCLVGFIIARFVILRVTTKPRELHEY